MDGGSAASALPQSSSLTDMEIAHNDESLGTITSRRDAEAIRDSMRGSEFRYGIVSNALDFALSGDERHLVYLSPRDRRKAEELAREVRETIESEPHSRQS